MRLVLSLLAVLALVSGTAMHLRAAEDADPAPLPGPFRHIRVVDFENDMIDAVLAAYVDRQIAQARETGADCVVLRIDSPGGTVRDSMKIADLLLAQEATPHIVGWIPKMAYSGAAMVALACDEIVMGRDAHFGDAQPGMQVPEGWKPVGEKAESPLRAKFYNYAKRNGYPTALAEAMVSDRMEVLKVRDPEGGVHYVDGKGFRAMEDEAEIFPGVLKKDVTQVGLPVVQEDELLTLTATEADAYGFLKRRFEGGRAFPDDEEELLTALKAQDAVVDFAEMSFSERASRLLLGIAGVLAAIVAIAILVTLWQGPGTMMIVGIVALVLVLLINVTADQLHGFPIFLIAVGALLLAAEVFLIPGWGIAGLLGILAMGAGFLFLAGGATIDDTSGVTGDLLVRFGLQFVATVLAGLIGLFALARLAPGIGPARRLVLAGPTPTDVVPPVVHAAVGVGQRGRAITTLRPAGTAEFDGAQVDVVADGGFVAPNRPVEVVAVEGNRVTVRPLGDADDEDDA